MSILDEQYNMSNENNKIKLKRFRKEIKELHKEIKDLRKDLDDKTEQLTEDISNIKGILNI